ncbi:MAG: amidohydrolase family protein [Qipengyuania sp.]|uniref:amidohydrolase family protein n=1 Tax=Qipengyuania sp. TaxID=2004515 RepID=UPI003001EC71
MKALATLLASAAIAVAAPAAAQSFVVTNATVASGDGSEPIESGYVVVENGKVSAIGSGTPASNLSAIDANGAWVTPGIFATLTSLGLWDVGAVSESNDTRAGGAPFSAALDVAPVINPSSQHILVHRASGITRAATVTLPSSSIFGGQGAVIDLGADPDAVTQARAFQVVALGEYGGRIAGGSRVATHTLLRAALREASANRAATSADIRSDEVLLTRFDAAALAPVVRGEQPLYVYVERASDIRSTLALKSEFPRLDLVLVGASEGWLVAREIAAAGVPVIADGLDDLPANFEELAATQSNIGRMVKAGVKVALNAAAMENPRNLNQYAGNLVALTRVPGADGLSWGQAFAAITSVPASISGMGGKAGVLAPGAMGDLVIWDGDPLQVGSMPVKVFIDGVEQPLDNHQSRLKERYRDLDESDLPKGYDW